MAKGERAAHNKSVLIKFRMCLLSYYTFSIFILQHFLFDLDRVEVFWQSILHIRTENQISRRPQQTSLHLKRNKSGIPKSSSAGFSMNPESEPKAVELKLAVKGKKNCAIKIRNNKETKWENHS